MSPETGPPEVNSAPFQNEELDASCDLVFKKPMMTQHSIVLLESMITRECGGLLGHFRR
jgi:hypothetical protein